MSDDRRDKYAAALLTIWREADWDVSEHDLADAAIAVADEEFSAGFERNTKLLAENARLRDELADATAALACKCSDDVVCADLYADAHGQWTAEINENARLRAELTQLKTAAGIVTTNRWYERLGRAEATIERVRAAATRARDSNNDYDIDDLIRAALEETP